MRGATRVAMSATVLFLAVTATAQRPGASWPCLRLAFDAWSPPLDWASAGHAADSSASGKAARRLRDSIFLQQPGSAADGMVWDEKSAGRRLFVFPAWWPAGISIEFDSATLTRDTLQGVAEAIVADGDARRSTARVRALRVDCGGSRQGESGRSAGANSQSITASRSWDGHRSRMVNHVVARYANGHVLKGTSLDVDPKRTTFHVRTPDGKMVDVAMADLKALFFVRSLSGDSVRKDSHDIAPSDARLRGARLVEVKFKDGEKITALALRYPPNQAFFFLTPVDVGGNNIRILVNGGFVESIAVVKVPAVPV
ncbi:MAG: hypothetical protein MNPFHGCM_00209 [Gemmatimonadaceae bacterium]|nr:hypothetical protein [Gemmatimonadaceae bacterium]